MIFILFSSMLKTYCLSSVSHGAFMNVTEYQTQPMYLTLQRKPCVSVNPEDAMVGVLLAQSSAPGLTPPDH